MKEVKQLGYLTDDDIETPYTNKTTGQKIYITKSGSILPNKFAVWQSRLLTQ
jgi:hypothetical protein